MPGEWNGSQSESFENYKKYIYDLYASFEDGVTKPIFILLKNAMNLRQLQVLGKEEFGNTNF